jgi:two-component system, NarL family, sensor kinase
MGTYQLSLYHAVITACVVIGGLMAYSLVSRIRSHRRYFAELRRQSYQVANLQEEERTRLSFDLHDGILPVLASIRLLLRKGRREQNAAKLLEAEERLVRAIEELRGVLRNLTPRNLEEKGLQTVLETLFAHYQALYPTSIHFRYGVPVPVPDRIAIHLYRLVQEAVHNALTHSDASQVQVSIQAYKNHLYIVCEDNGKGLPATQNNGLGLSSLRFRSVILNGRLQCSSSPGKGTRYLFTIPFSTAHGTH